MWLSEKNTHLTVSEDVVLTETIDPVIAALDRHYAERDHKAVVTSGLRTFEDQVRILQNLAKDNGVDKEYPGILTKQPLHRIWFKGQAVYEWQLGWSRLLNLGVIVNPPRPAVCLMDYVRSGVNKKGIVIGQSPHMFGRAFDVGGGENSVEDELAIAQEALPHLHGLLGVVVERKQNCLHHDCRPFPG